MTDKIRSLLSLQAGAPYMKRKDVESNDHPQQKMGKISRHYRAMNDKSPKPRSTLDLRQILNQIVQINYSVNNK